MLHRLTLPTHTVSTRTPAVQPDTVVNLVHGVLVNLLNVAISSTGLPWRGRPRVVTHRSRKFGLAVWNAICRELLDATGAFVAVG